MNFSGNKNKPRKKRLEKMGIKESTRNGVVSHFAVGISLAFFTLALPEWGLEGLMIPAAALGVAVITALPTEGWHLPPSK